MPIQIPQTAVATVPYQAISGLHADGGFCRIESGILEAAADSGYGVITGATAVTGTPVVVESYKLPGVIGDLTSNFRGVILYDPAKVPASSTLRYAIGDSVKILVKGLVWVPITGNVSIDTPVYCVYSGAGNLGKFRGDNTNATLVPNAKWRRDSVAATAPGLALLELY